MNFNFQHLDTLNLLLRRKNVTLCDLVYIKIFFFHTSTSRKGKRGIDESSNIYTKVCFRIGGLKIIVHVQLIKYETVM